MKQQAPIYIEINEYGNKYYHSDREMKVLHRLDGPAAERSDGTKSWYLNGRLHRTDGPAIEGPSSYKEWWQNGQRHREDGPAIQYSNGDKYWYQNGKLHREDGPAIEHTNGNKEWWQNGQLHRADGPAIEWPDGAKSWYLNDVYMTEAEFLAETAPKEVHELTLDDIADRLGIPVENLKIVKEHQQ